MATDFATECHDDDLFEKWNGSLTHADFAKCGAGVAVRLESHQLVFWVLLLLDVCRVVDRLREVHVARCDLRVLVALCEGLHLRKQLVLFFLRLLHSLGASLVLLVGQLAGSS